MASDSTQGKLKHTIEEQELDDIESNATYWENLPENEEGQKIEPLQANPDGLIDESEIYENERDQYYGQLSNIQDAMKKVLSIREVEAINLLQRGLDYDKIALNMKVSKATVQVLIDRARQKLLPFLSLE